MKAILTIALALFCFQSSAQIKILDCTADWDAHQLLTFTSDTTGVQSIDVKLGTAYDGSDVLQYSASVVTDIPDNMIAVPLTNITPGNYFVNVTLHRTDGSQAVIELKL